MSADFWRGLYVGFSLAVLVMGAPLSRMLMIAARRQDFHWTRRKWDPAAPNYREGPEMGGES